MNLNITENQIEKIINVLKNVSIFSDLDEYTLREIATRLTLMKIKRSEIVFSKGEIGNSMYIIVNGSVKIHDGGHVFTVLTNEQFFGEFSLLDSQIRSASVTAMVETELLKLDQDTFYDITTKTPIVTKGVFKSIVRRLYDKDRLEEELAEKNAQIQQQKEEIEAQRDEIEAQRDEIEAQRDQVIFQRDQIVQQKKAITDSIKYASRIQTAVLPPNDLLNNIFPKHFILYKPRDIVSGDFYWFKEVHLNESTVYIVAAADGTGHGVPGAFMSMLGISFLNEIVNKYIESKANKIYASELLNSLRQHVITALNQPGKESETQDGMDIALCIIDLQKNEMQYAGANNSMYLVRQETEPQQIISPRIETVRSNTHTLYEYKADKMPVGIHFRQEYPFENQIIKLHENDIFYIFSDGYIDQFGGPFGRKFLSKHFKELILKLQGNDLAIQRTILDKQFEDWRLHYDQYGKHFEQIDDIMVIGIQI